MITLLKTLILFLLLAAPAAQAGMFQCFYADGSSRWSDNNCPSAVAQVDMSLKGSWMMRKPKGASCRVVCDGNSCSSGRTKIKLRNKKDAVLEAMEKLPKAHQRQRSVMQNCRNCRGKRRATSAANACDLVVYQSVIKQFYKGVSRQVSSDYHGGKRKLRAVQRSCNGPNAAKPQRETPYGKVLSCKEQTKYRTAVSNATLHYNRSRREFARLKAGSIVLELEAPR